MENYKNDIVKYVAKGLRFIHESAGHQVDTSGIAFLINHFDDFGDSLLGFPVYAGPGMAETITIITPFPPLERHKIIRKYWDEFIQIYRIGD